MTVSRFDHVYTKGTNATDRNLKTINKELEARGKQTAMLYDWLSHPAYREWFRPVMVNRILAINRRLTDEPMNEVTNKALHETRKQLEIILKSLDSVVRQRTQDLGVELVRDEKHHIPEEPLSVVTTEQEESHHDQGN